MLKVALDPDGLYDPIKVTLPGIMYSLVFRIV